MTATIVEVRDLSRRFGKTQALDSVSLTVRSGLVYGLVGANGQGKTTLMRHLPGLLRAQQGTVRVFGLDPVRHPIEVLQRIGYLSEERDLPEWMRIGELLRYTAAFHPRWDHKYAEELVETFGLDANKKVKQLSKGMRAQAGLIAAVASRPDLLLLDEPSTGLDAVVRKDILDAIIRAVADDGRTVIFSSHLLDEVELMSDRVFMINTGRLVLEGELDALTSRHRTMTARLPEISSDPREMQGVLSAERSGDSWKLVCDEESGSVETTVRSLGGEITHSRSASLHEIFVSRVERDRQTLAQGG